MKTCKGSGRIAPRAEVRTVWSWESNDGLRHDTIDCPVCNRTLKAPNDFIVRHKAGG